MGATMYTLAAGEPVRGLLAVRGRALEAVGRGGVRPQPGVAPAGGGTPSCTHDMDDAAAAESVGRSWALGELVTGGEATKPSDPPPLSAVPSANQDRPSSALPSLESFLDLSPLRPESDKADPSEDADERGPVEDVRAGYGEGPGEGPGEGDALSVASSSTICSTAYTISIPTAPTPAYTPRTFFDWTPSPTEASPHRLDHGPWTAGTVPAQSPEHMESRLRSRYAESEGEGAEAMKSIPWRPRSAPKASSSAKSHSYDSSASPFRVRAWKDWPSEAGPQGLSRLDTDFFVAMPRRKNDEAAHVDSVSNHLGKLRKATKLGPGWPKWWVNEADGQGSRAAISREEYMSLPLAIQRKCFSVPERLELGESESRIFHRHDRHDRKHRQACSSPESWTASQGRRDSSDVPEALAAPQSDSSWLADFHHGIRNVHRTREDQVHLLKHLRASGILQAAKDAYTVEALCNDRNPPPTPDINSCTATLSSRRGSLDSMVSAMEHLLELGGKDAMRQSLYDSFRWLDEEDHLDLGLTLDEYHANLREHVSPTSRNWRPSFRRRISISKLPFACLPTTASRPESRDSPTSSSRARSPPNPPNHHRRRSRTLSIMTSTKLVHAEQTPVIDFPATHYQDPEARHKLRAYLASPSKFDEAVQYGFPATDLTQSAGSLDTQGHHCPPQSDGSEKIRSFLDSEGDEDGDGNRDDASSLSDLESPMTPQLGGGLTPPPGHYRNRKSSTDPLTQSGRSRKPIMPIVTSSDSSSREMTLRMTLTRPDLRANDELIYGWQPQAAYISARRKSQTPLPRSEPTLVTGRTTAAYGSDSHVPKVDVEHALAGLDHWNPDHGAGDKNVVKRFWNKVRRA